MDTVGSERRAASVPSLSSGLADLKSAGVQFVEDYGWFIVIAVAISIVVWKQYIAKNVSRLSLVSSDVPSDPRTILSRNEALLAARERMQEEQRRLSAKAKEEAAKREEEKRQQKIEEWEMHQQGRGYHNKTHFGEEEGPSSGLVKRKGNKPLKDNDYSPLSGSGGCNYRPPRRSCCPSGGGCGR